MHTLLKLGLFLILFLGVQQLILNELDKVPSENSVTVTSFKTEADMIDEQFPTLELYLVNQKEIDGYIVETYREHEVYKDENGDVIKEVPTANYNYIRYKEY